MSLKDVNYDAFISYRHADKDIYIASTLQRKLESFKLPKSLQEKGHGKTRIERVFRDQDELPLAANLSDPINEALVNSGFLLVICTPRLQESEWCRKEIETFLSLHGREHILLILAEGEPSDSFPDILLHETTEITDTNGNKKIITRDVEPLAADVRGLSPHEIKKKIDDAVLKIAASIFNLNYDDLKQRNRERRTKRLIAIWGSISTAVLTFAIVCAVMLIQISTQKETIEQQYAVISAHDIEMSSKNLEITQQNEEISLKNEEITRQKEEIQLQYKEAAKDYARSMANISADLLASGNRTDALYTIRKAIPTSISAEDYPYTQEGHMALVNALGIYGSDDLYIASSIYEADADILSFSFSDDSNYLAILSSENRILVYRVSDNELIMNSEEITDKKIYSFCFLDNHTLCASLLTEGLLIDINTKNTVSISDSELNCICTMPEKNMFFVCHNNTLSAFSLEDYHEIWSKDLADNNSDVFYFYSELAVTFSPNNEYVFVSGYDYMGNGFVRGLKSDDGQEFFEKQFSEIIKLDVKASDTILFINLFTGTNSFWVEDAQNTISAIDFINDEPLWEFSHPDSQITRFEYFPSDDRLLLIGKNELFCCSADNYSDISSYPIDSDVTLIKANTENNVIIITENNVLYVFNLQKNAIYDITSNTLYSVPPQKNNLADYTSEKLFFHYVNDSYITEYSLSTNEDIEVIGSYQNSYCISPTGKYQISTDLDYETYECTTYLINTATEEKTEIADENAEYYFIGDDDELLISCGSNCIKQFDSRTGQLINSASAPSPDSIWGEISSGRKLIPAINGNQLTLLNSDSLTDFCVFETDSPISYNSRISDGNRKIYMSLDIETGHLKAYDILTGLPVLETDILIRNFNTCLLSSDGKYVLLNYKDGRTDIYDLQTFSLVSSLYDISDSPGRFIYLEKLNSYAVIPGFSNTWVLLDSDLKPFTTIDKCYGYNNKTNRFTMLINNRIFTIPYYDYDTLVEKTDSILEKTRCSNATKRKYNIE